MTHFTRFLLSNTLAALACSVALQRADATGHAHHVVVVVWDGMRPDFVSAEHTPNLWKLAQGGVTFRNHHPAYPASTEVNGTTMATGNYPVHSGIVANREYRPAVDPSKPVAMEAVATVQASGSNYIRVQTLVRELRRQGLTTAVAGSKGVALLQDCRQALASGSSEGGRMIVAGHAYPAADQAELEAALGKWPETVEFPNSPQDRWTAAALTEVLWKDAVPAFSMLWLSDPDFSQHHTAPGAPTALAAIQSVDDRLGAILAALEAKGVRGDTDVFVISDHGFSTVGQPADLAAQLQQAGLKASFIPFYHAPAPGQIMAVANGGSTMFYIIGHDAGVGRKLVRFLQKTPEAGVIFSRWPEPGTFSLHEVRIDSPEAPDVVVAFRWSAKPNQYGAPGLLDIGGNLPAGAGTHASLSRYEMHNTLIAAGPDFKKGAFDTLPTGNIDLAPTVLNILTPQAAKLPLDGRVLTEAMTGTRPTAKVSHRLLEAHSPDKSWSQYLKISQVGTTLYFDEGNSGKAP